MRLAALATKPKPQCFGLAIKTSGRTGQVTYYLSAPRPSWRHPIRSRRRIDRHVRILLRDAGCPAGATVLIDTPNRRGRMRQKEYRWL